MVQSSQFRWILVCLVVAGLFGCSKKDGAEEASYGYFKPHFQDEAQYVVEEVMSDIAEMAFYAKNKRLPEEKKFHVYATEDGSSTFRAPKYVVEIRLEKKLITVNVDVSGPIWSPEVYRDATTALLTNLGVATVDMPPLSPEDKLIFQTLLNPKAERLQEEDQTLSTALAANIWNPQLHEQAALLLGTFSLRESSGEFYNIRQPLCRLTAHLAFARGLTRNPEYGAHGQLAMAELYVLMNNQKGALEWTKRFEGPEMEPWARLLRARATHDYRDLLALKQRSLLENVECFRAYCISVSTDQAWDAFDNKQFVQVPDYCRIVNDVGYSVGIGHVMSENSLPLELKELREAYQAYHGKELQKEEIIKALNQKPTRCLTRNSKGKPSVNVSVIGWGQWAFFSQRHFCHTFRENFKFLNESLGVPESAAQYKQVVEQGFSGLYLYPFVRRYICMDEADYHKAEDEAFPITVENPQYVSAQIWNYLCYKPRFAERYVPAPNPHVNEWHKHNPLPGTVYELHPRLNHPSLTSRGDTLQVMEQLLAIAPYDGELIRDFIKRKYAQTEPTYAELEPIYHQSLAYNVNFMTSLARTLWDRPAEYEKLMIKAANYNSCLYLDIGDYFVRQTNDVKGAEYLAKAMDECQNSVASANHAGWLSKYYHRNNQKDKAYKVASFAADQVYSYAGLRAKAQLLEMDERWDEAFEYYKKIEERYGNRSEVPEFCLRYKSKTGGTRFDNILQDEQKRFFPRGQEKVTLASFSGAPDYGVLIKGESDELKKVGLNNGDIIVSLNGVRVYELEQYNYVRDLGKSSELNLIVWKNGQYYEVQANPPNRKFGVGIQSYRSKKQ